MATGGYKCVKFSWQGGRTDTPVDRTKFVLNGVCDAIIGANAGWALDTLTPTSSDFIQFPSYQDTSNPNLLKVLTLSHNNHSYKMGIGLIYYNYAYFANDSSPTMKPEDCSPSNKGYSSSERFNQNGRINSGLYIGIVKDGTFVTDSTYALVWDGTGEFTRWCPFCLYQSGSDDSFVYNNSSSKLYTYYFALKGAQIIAMARASNWSTDPKLKVLIIGEIYKKTAHLEDVNTMGCVGLFTAERAESLQSTDTYGIYGASGYYHPTYQSQFYVMFSLLSSNGTPYFGTLTPSDSNAKLYNTYLTLDQVVATSAVSENRWTPVGVYINAVDRDTYYVVPGDGFKGYIDTDLLRGVNPNYSYGQLLADGDFVHLGCGLAIGWDADNEILLF